MSGEVLIFYNYWSQKFMIGTMTVRLLRKKKRSARREQVYPNPALESVRATLASNLFASVRSARDRTRFGLYP